MNLSSDDRTTHLSDERVLAYIDGELPEGESREVGRHVERCASCAARRDELRTASSRLSRELRALDVRPPDPEPPTARAGEPSPGSPASFAEEADGMRSAPARRRRFLVAAMLLLTFTGIGLAAVPGSPLRGWLVRSAERVTSLFSSGEVEVTGMEAAESASAGVTVGSREDRLLVVLTDPAPETMVRLRLVRGERATVRAPGARYRAAPGRIEVLEARSGVIVLELPVDVPSARVEVDGRTVVVRENGDLRFLIPSVDSAGSEFSFPVRARSEEP